MQEREFVKRHEALHPPSKSVNLFGWNPKGLEETSRLLKLFIRGNDFQFEARTASNTILLRAPFKYQYRILSLCDNGGEVNVEWVNHPDSLHSVASCSDSRHLNAETMHYRIMTVLDGEEIDYNHEEEAFEDINLLGRAS